MALHLPQAPEPQEVTDIAADLPPGTRALLDAAPKLLRELEVQAPGSPYAAGFALQWGPH